MQKNPHSELVNECLLALGSLPNIRIWKNATGVAQTMNGSVIRFGLTGSPDLIGIIKGSGKFLGVECKTGQAVQTRAQKNFESMVKSFGGVYIVARDVKGLLKDLAQCTLL